MKTTLFKSLVLAALSFAAASLNVQAQNVTIDETTFPDSAFRKWVLAQTYGADGVLTPDEISAVTNIEIAGRNISSLQGIEYFTALTYLECLNNLLTSLDVSKNTALTYLGCQNNQLTELDVSKNTALKVFGCYHNFLRDLDLSNNPSLTNISISPQYPFDEVVVGGSNRDVLAVPMPQIEAARIANLKCSKVTLPLEYVTIGGENHLVIASSNNVATHFHLTNENDSEVTYTVTPKYNPFVSSSVRRTMDVFLRYLPFHALYLDPASLQNGVYTGTLYLDVPTVIPTDCDLKAYAAEGITQASEEAGRLVLSQAKTGVLPTGSGVIVTATQPGLHLFTGDAVVNSTTYGQASTTISYNTSPTAYSGNILAGTYASLFVPYGSVLTLGPRRDDGSGTIGFWNYAGTQLRPYSCYIPTSEIPSMNSGSGTRFMGLSLLFSDEEGTVTGIDAAPAGNSASAPTAAVYYDLQGRRVAEPRKGGVYIVNGRKIVF